MSVYIKGMKMPKSCHECVGGYGGFCFVAPPESDANCPNKGRPDWCPLVEVPPHGRLIDADAVIDLVMQYCPDDDGVCSKAGADLRELLDEIENLPTVIPATEVEEET